MRVYKSGTDEPHNEPAINSPLNPTDPIIKLIEPIAITINITITINAR